MSVFIWWLIVIVVVDCGFGLFMLFVALLSRILTLVENPGILWLEGVLLLIVG